MNRRGVSLVELLAVISATSVVLGVGSGLLHRALALQSATRLHLEHDRTALALGRQFRDDAHAAAEVDLRGAAPRVVHVRRSDGTTVEYVATRNRLRRRAAAADGRVVVEDYRFPAGTVWRAVIDGPTLRMIGSGPATGGAVCDVELVGRLPGSPAGGAP